MALLRWIDTLPAETIIPQVILIACNADYQPGRADTGGFYDTPLHYQMLRNKCKSITFIHSEDDPFVPINRAEGLARKRGAKFKRYQHAGHFGWSKITAPEILAELNTES